MNSTPGSIPATEVVAVIPARYGSTRFPGKPLELLWDKPLIAHVVAAALSARRVGTVMVATDDERIARVAREAGARVAMTRPDHSTGSDRIGEAIAEGKWPIVLNVQGDEPLVPPVAIDRLVELLEEHLNAAVSTLASPLDEGSPEHLSPHVVKVVCSEDGQALYFSRAPIPGRHPRNAEEKEAVEGGYPGGMASALRHVGLYGFRREAFERFLAHPRTPLEKVEGLEQLRFLEMGESIVADVIESLPPGVDTPADLERLQSWRKV